MGNKDNATCIHGLSIKTCSRCSGKKTKKFKTNYNDDDYPSINYDYNYSKYEEDDFDDSLDYHNFGDDEDYYND